MVGLCEANSLFMETNLPFFLPIKYAHLREETCMIVGLDTTLSICKRTEQMCFIVVYCMCHGRVFQCKYRIRHVLFQVATHVDSGHTHRMPGQLMWTRSKCNWSNSKLDIRIGGSILCCIYIHTLNEHLMPLHLRGRKTRCPFFTWGMLHL